MEFTTTCLTFTHAEETDKVSNFSPPSTSPSEFVQVLETAPLGLVFGSPGLGYSLIINKNAFGVFGATSLKYSFSKDQSSFLSGIYYARNFDLFVNDPSFIGTSFTYSQAEGKVKLGEDQYNAKLEAANAFVGLYYGHAYRWRNGFTMSWRLGIALPVVWDYKWNNVSNIEEEKFKDDTEMAEGISKIVSVLLGGSGWNVGWSF